MCLVKEVVEGVFEFVEIGLNFLFDLGGVNGVVVAGGVFGGVLNNGGVGSP